MSSLQKELLSIIERKKLTPYFQPIISLTEKKVMGYEALIRGPSNSSLHSPLNLFEVAERYKLSIRLEFLCRKISIQQYANFNLDAKLFINVSPNVLLQPQFKAGETLRYLEKVGLNPDKVVIEVTEYKPSDDYELMREAVLHYRDMGFKIAMDNLGAGYSGLRLWSELLPEYIKIDRHFIQELQNDQVKLNFVRSIQSIANSLHCHVIAEGVETQEELRVIQKLGISYAQGYYLARPAAESLANIDFTSCLEGEPATPKPIWSSSISVDTLNLLTPPISAETPINEVMELFRRHRDLTILPLVDDEVASGIVFRDVFLSKLFASHYGVELYGKKPIKTFIEHSPLSIDYNTPIEQVSIQLTSAMRYEQAFIITRENKYAGMVTVLSLLEKITQQQIENARHANPLTLLPGSVPMNEQINQLISSKTAFAFGYFDLDNFKPFNDIYGYSAGDEIIKAVAKTLTECVATEAGRVGHIGGDDFIVIFTGNDWLECCQRILATFAQCVPNHYTVDDVKAGGICAENRIGEKCFYPMTSLSVGLVDPDTTSQCQSHVDIADLASEAKKMAKKMEGNSYFINLRKNPKILEIPSPKS